MVVDHRVGVEGEFVYFSFEFLTVKKKLTFVLGKIEQAGIDGLGIIIFAPLN